MSLNQVKPLESDPFKDKRGSWLKHDQKNLLQHTEADHIFNHQIQDYDHKFRNIRDSKVPKAEQFMFGNEETPQRTQKKRPQIPDRGHSYEAPRGRENNRRPSLLGQKSNVSEDQAMQRRNDAKRNLISRRQKLALLLRSSW